MVICVQNTEHSKCSEIIILPKKCDEEYRHTEAF